jgi:hypothetical protein
MTLRSVFVGKLIKLGIAPVEDGNARNKTRASLDELLGDILDDLYVSILEHGRHNVLLKGTEVLGDLTVNLVVLLPKLKREKWGETVRASRCDRWGAFSRSLRPIYFSEGVIIPS